MTSKGFYNKEKAQAAYEALKKKLNSKELSLITDFLVIDKHVMGKTANLLMMDMESLLKRG